MPEFTWPDLLLHLQACPPDFFRPTHGTTEQWNKIIRALFHDFWFNTAPSQNKGPSPSFLLPHSQSMEWVPPLCWLLSHPCLSAVEKTDNNRIRLFNLAQRLDSAFPPKEVLYNRMRAEECLREMFSAFDLPVPGEQSAQSTRRLHYLSSLQKQQRDQLRQAKRQRAAAIQQAKERLEAMENDND